MDSMEVLSRVYALLGDAESRDLDKAARLVPDSELSQALHLLARYRHRHRASSRRSARVTTRPVQETLLPNSRAVSTPMINGVHKRIKLLSAMIPSTKELVRYLNETGLAIRFDRKAGRARMLERLAQHLESLSVKDQLRHVPRVFRALPKSETAEWFDAIRGD